MTKEEYLAALGNKIYEVRKRKGITQAELGARIKKDQQSVQRLEKGNINPSIYYLIEIAGGLEISIQELLNFEIPEKKGI